MERHYADSYSAVMDENKNPLQKLPKVVRFQIMVFLSLMWSTIFCVAIGSWFWWGELVIGHVAIATGVLITALTFQQASRRGALNDRISNSVRYEGK